MPVANTAAPVLEDAIVLNTAQEIEFWKHVYLTSVSEGRGIPRRVADQAIRELRDRYVVDGDRL